MWCADNLYPSFGLFGPFLASLATLAHFGNRPFSGCPLGSTMMLIEATLIPKCLAGQKWAKKAKNEVTIVRTPLLDPHPRRGCPRAVFCIQDGYKNRTSRPVFELEGIFGPGVVLTSKILPRHYRVVTRAPTIHRFYQNSPLSQKWVKCG